MQVVVLDLETSGLSSQEDSIIEVAALKFDTVTQESEEWSSLINPGFIISEEITFLTNIHPEQLKDAPYFEDVFFELKNFIGNCPIIGHNVGFDIEFLRQNGLDIGYRPVIDTFHLANFLFHTQKSLNLSNLVEELGYVHDDAHRAMSDVRATKFLFDAEVERIKNFSKDQYGIFESVVLRAKETSFESLRNIYYSEFSAIFEEKFELHSPLDFQDGTLSFGESTGNGNGIGSHDGNGNGVLQKNQQKGAQKSNTWDSPNKRFFRSKLESIRNSQMVVFSEKKLPEYLDDGISASDLLDACNLPYLAKKSNLENRPEQFKLTDLVEDTFTNKKHVCIEAPTGVGKTFSYLIPAIKTSLATGKTVCISTNTKTLQDQICSKDIPKVLDLLRKEGIDGIRYQKLKGRSNYFSWLKFFEFFDQESLTPEEAGFALKIAFWVLDTDVGELDEITLYGAEFQFIQDINASDLRVTSPDNPWKEFEYLLIARTRLSTAHIAILNHALLLTEYLEDSQMGILPKLEHLVLDEVHNLESVATDTLRSTCTVDDVLKQVQDIEKIIKKFNKENPAAPFLDPNVTSSTQGILLAAGDFYEACLSVLGDKKEQVGGYGKGKSTDLLVESTTLDSVMEDISRARDSFYDRIHDLEASIFGGPEGIVQQLGRVIDILYAYHAHFSIFTSKDAKNSVRVISKREHGPAQTIVVPLSVGDVLQEKVWNKIPAVVMMSATLCINNSFEYIEKVLHTNQFEYHILKTDFDYSKQCLLYIPTGFGDIRKNEQKHAIEVFLKDLLAIYKGRTLMLFTSFASIRDMALSLGMYLKGIGVDVLAQGLGGGKHRLATAFAKNAHKSVLLGTDSFWEGVDFPGDLLELLVIYKLPFSVPTDPVIVARSRLYSDSFQEYVLPMMILKLRQGIGRLIRTKNDKGVIVVMDSRITAPWGSTILESLPAGMPVRQASPEVFLTKLREKMEDVNAKTV